MNERIWNGNRDENISINSFLYRIRIIMIIRMRIGIWIMRIWIRILVMRIWIMIIRYKNG